MLIFPFGKKKKNDSYNNFVKRTKNKLLNITATYLEGEISRLLSLYNYKMNMKRCKVLYKICFT